MALRGFDGTLETLAFVPELGFEVGKSVWIRLGVFVIAFAANIGGNSLGTADGNAFLICVGLVDAQREGDDENVVCAFNGVEFSLGERLEANEGSVLGVLVW